MFQQAGCGSSGRSRPFPVALPRCQQEHSNRQPHAPENPPEAWRSLGFVVSQKTFPTTAAEANRDSPFPPRELLAHAYGYAVGMRKEDVVAWRKEEGGGD